MAMQSVGTFQALHQKFYMFIPQLVAFCVFAGTQRWTMSFNSLSNSAFPKRGGAGEGIIRVGLVGGGVLP